MRIWWNGRHGRLKICCRKTCGFKSHYPHLLFKLIKPEIPLALDNRQFTHTLYGVCFYFLYTPTQINYRKSQNTLLTHLFNFYILDNSRITLFHRLSTNGLLGHSSVAFTMNIYVHLIEEQKSNAVNLIDDL